jgi:formylglycine-generating enzyme required for sulfatase activity
MAAGVALLAIVAVWPQGNPVPVPPPVEASPFPPGQATQESPYRNTLGMRFVPVPGADILMAVWETRAGDYAACAAEESGVDRAWRSGATAPDLPVVNVSWEDARAFCAWLSRKEGRTYRLPSDHEWSLAVGIGDREDAKASPAEKDMKIRDVYPWGTEWPPPSGAGNYGLIPGFSDPHSGLAPVGSYRPNALGIFDLGGNVWEWVGDTWEPTSSSRVVRGASWLQYGPGHLLSSYRNLDVPTRRLTYNGFRVVLEVGEGER